MPETKEIQATFACPSCNSWSVKPSSRRTLLDYLLAPIFFTPYRCRHCQHRFYRNSAFVLPQKKKRRHRPPLIHMSRSTKQIVGLVVLMILVYLLVFVFMQRGGGAPPEG